MDRRIETVGVWIAPAGLTLLLVGLLMADMLPPLPAHDTAQQVAHFYQQHSNLKRAGLLLCFVGCAGWAPLVAVISRLMRRGGRDTLSFMQMIGGTAAWMFLLLPFLILAVAAYRPDRPAATTQAIHDLGWITLAIPFVPFVVQNIAIGLRVLTDKAAVPLFPRWIGYLNLWVAFSFVPPGLLLFFKTGPFAYHALFAFYLPLATFGPWLLIMPWACHQAIKAEALAELEPERRAPTADVPAAVV